MYRYIFISILAAAALAELPCFEISNSGEKVAMIIGMTASVFIFCLFCEDVYEKWVNYRNRVRKIRRIVKKLRFTRVDLI